MRVENFILKDAGLVVLRRAEEDWTGDEKMRVGCRREKIGRLKGGWSDFYTQFGGMFLQPSRHHLDLSGVVDVNMISV